MKQFSDILTSLKQIGQEHLLRYWDQLSSSEQKDLLNQISTMDLTRYPEQRKLAQTKDLHYEKQIESFAEFETTGSQTDFSTGKKLISEGKVGCLVVAGGQGTRLGSDEPKGCFPITTIKQKSLFQLLAEKVLAAGNQAQRKLPVAIMTSKDNHQKTVKFFEQHNFFGLDPTQISFFSQSELPLLDLHGYLFLETKTKVSVGADGNGSSLQQFVKQGILNKWKKQGIEYLNFILIDNALADPFDAELIGFQHRHHADVVVKCVKRKDENEKVGLLVTHEGKTEVVEYSEISTEEAKARNSKGELKHQCANISLFSMTLSFVQNLMQKGDDIFPLHKAKKAVKFLDNDGTTKKASNPNAWKFEKFIFDILPHAKKIKALLYPREVCFAPLKNFEGDDSIETVKQSLQNYDRITYEKISGKKIDPTTHFELDPQFYYPTPEIIKSWKGQDLPSEKYVKPE